MTATALLLKPILNPTHQQGASAKRSVVKAVTYGLALGCLDSWCFTCLPGKPPSLSGSSS
jgi:hypothetical protein